MTATQHDGTTASALVLGIELSLSTWVLAFSTPTQKRVRVRRVQGGDVAALAEEIERAKEHFKLPAETLVVSCYEAGRDGFWLHRWLVSQGVGNLVVDSSSIEVNRRRRRAKTDRLDASKLVQMLLRYQDGETRVWRVVNVPSVEDEAARQLHRELEELKKDRTRLVNRITSEFATLGLSAEVTRDLPEKLHTLRLCDGSMVPTSLADRITRQLERWEQVDDQKRVLERHRRELIRRSDTEPIEKVRQLMSLRGIGENSAWLWVMEVFGWREIRNRRELGALAGLTPTPYDSGGRSREQGISKAGNRRVRVMAIEIAWCWLRFQPDSELSQWFQDRYGSRGSRARRVGIVAVARKLLVQLWKYLETGELPPGAVLS